MSLKILLLSAAINVCASDRLLLDSIGLVETGGDWAAIGDRSRATGPSVGAFQIGPEAWADANAQLKVEGRKTYPRSDWRSRDAQRQVGLAYLRVLRRRLEAGGIPATPEHLALCWNKGYAGAMRDGFRLNGYAYRVGNLFALASSR